MIAPSKYGQQAMTKLQAVSRSRRKPAGELIGLTLRVHASQSRQSRAELSQAEPWQHYRVYCHTHQPFFGWVTAESQIFAELSWCTLIHRCKIDVPVTCRCPLYIWRFGMM